MSEILDPEIVATKIVITGSTPGIACSGAEERRPVYAHELAATLAPHLRPLLSAPEQAQAHQGDAQSEIDLLRAENERLRAALEYIDDELIKELNAQIAIVKDSKERAWENRRVVGPNPNRAFIEECGKRIRIAQAAIRSQSTRLIEESVTSLAAMGIYVD